MAFKAYQLIEAPANQIPAFNTQISDALNKGAELVGGPVITIDGKIAQAILVTVDAPHKVHAFIERVEEKILGETDAKDEALVEGQESPAPGVLASTIASAISS